MRHSWGDQSHTSWDSYTIPTSGTITASAADTDSSYWTTNTGASSITLTDSYAQGTLSVQGDADFNGDVKLKGVSLTDTLKKLDDSLIQIEQRLNILRVDKELESRWDELKELGDRYREMQEDLLGREHIHRILSE